MTIQHFKKLYDIAKEKGVKSALEHDVIETLKRHPKLAGLAIASSMYFAKPQPEKEVYVDHCEIDDGKHQLRRQGGCPVSVAYNNGWISDAVYEAVTNPKR